MQVRTDRAADNRKRRTNMCMISTGTCRMQLKSSSRCTSLAPLTPVALSVYHTLFLAEEPS